MDQCKHCTCRGDLEKCKETPCTHHETWYAHTTQATLRKAVMLLKKAEDELSDFDFMFSQRDKELQREISEFMEDL